MPPTLRDWQATFAVHLLAGAPAPDKRLAVHRHHVTASLVRALAVTFPTIEALVDADFFGQAARHFIMQDPPTHPVLAEYGAGFAAFLADWAPARDLPYLADMARLDWALNAAFHSPRGDSLGAADLSALSVWELAGRSLMLAPGTALVRSAYPIDLIWRASQPGAPDDLVDLGRGAACLLVLRQVDGAGFVTLEKGEAAFVAALASGHTTEAAVEAAAGADAGFDLSRAFARLRGCEAFAATQQ